MHLLARRAKRELEQARLSEQRFRGLTELSADWFWETDAEDRLTWISGGSPVITFFGGTPTYGRRFWEIPGVEVDRRALEALQEGLREGRPIFDLEMARSDARGARQVHIISGQARKTPQGHFSGHPAAARVATERRRPERDLSRAKGLLRWVLNTAARPG